MRHPGVIDVQYTANHHNNIANTNTSVPASETNGSVLVDKDKECRRRSPDAAVEQCAFV